ARAARAPMTAVGPDPAVAGSSGPTGSARRAGKNSATTTAPRANATTENRYGPASEGSPSASPARSPGAVRLGPATAPIVVAQMTIDIARPRAAASTPSVAAYRDWRFAALATPNRPRPTRSSQS